MSNTQKEENKTSRWWETYLARYLVGTIVGALCIIYLINEIAYERLPTNKGTFGIPLNLAKYLTTMLPEDIHQINTPNLVLLAAAGFAFCYVASAPLTLLHYLRNYCSSDPLKKSRSFLWTNVKFWIIFLLLANISQCEIFLFMFFIIVIVVFVILFLFEFVYTPKNAFESAVKLNNPSLPGKDTYKHLSEHGNAYSILIMEFLLTVFIKNSTSPCALFLGLGIWVGSGAICWFAAKTIEFHFIEGGPSVRTSETREVFRETTSAKQGTITRTSKRTTKETNQ